MVTTPLFSLKQHVPKIGTFDITYPVNSHYKVLAVKDDWTRYGSSVVKMSGHKKMVRGSRARKRVLYSHAVKYYLSFWLKADPTNISIASTQLEGR